MTNSQPRHRITTLAPPRQLRLLPWRPGALLITLLAALLMASPALSAIRIGTSAGETLTGTKGNDHITGAEGSDTLQGKGGNDTYFFASGWGTDTLIEKPREGTDTLNFHGVTGELFIGVVREWETTNSVFYAVFGPTTELINFTSGTTIEKVIGGQGDGDDIYGGGGPNTLMPGGGEDDTLHDYGGWNDGPAAGRPEIPASNDTYKGFADNTGIDLIEDYGGSDVVDLRPLSTDDVYISRRALDGGTAESLQIVTSFTTQVVLVGHFEPYLNYTSAFGQQGRIEKLIFADVTFTTTSGLAAAVTASAETTSGTQADLAAVADRLAEEASALLAEQPKPGTLSAGVGRGGEVGPQPGGDTRQHTHAKDKKYKSGKQDKHDKKAKKAKKQGK